MHAHTHMMLRIIPLLRRDYMCMYVCVYVRVYVYECIIIYDACTHTHTHTIIDVSTNIANMHAYKTYMLYIHTYERVHIPERHSAGLHVVNDCMSDDKSRFAACICIYVYTFVCLYVCMHVCMHVVSDCMSDDKNSRFAACICMHVYMFVCMYVCRYVCMWLVIV